MRRERAVGLLALAFLAGCGTLEIDRKAFEAASPQRVAILPFVLVEEDPGARGEQKVASLRGVVARRFASTAYLSLRPDVVDRLLRGAGYATPAEVLAASPARLGELLGVDALIVGEIDSLSNMEGALLYHQTISGTVRLIDAKSGKPLVRIEHSESDTGGFLLEFSQSLEAVQHTLDNSSDLGFVRLAEKFAESVVSQIPPPPELAQPAQPVLGEITLTPSREGVLRTGDGLEIEVEADAGLRAELNLGNAMRYPLLEEEPGRYRAHYSVVVGDYLDKAMTVHVEDAFGNGASKVLRDRVVLIDARPPARPGEFKVEHRAGLYRLSWTPCKVTPAVAYRVYGLDRRGVPKLLAQVTSPAAKIQAAHPRYAVAGLDAQGNLGPLAVVEAAPVAGATDEQPVGLGAEAPDEQPDPGTEAPREE